MWHWNMTVTQTFGSVHSVNAWANIAGLGWLKIEPTSADGVTNAFMMMNAAKANNRTVHVYVNASNRIEIAYLN
jgi:hypothetical protein